MAVAVYVDDMYKLKLGRFGRMKMSHLIADTSEELIGIVNAIGVNPKWIQYAGTYKEHFDICLAKRKLAVANGAKEITLMQYARIVNQRRQG